MLAGGAFFEHSHRVIAGGLGIFTLALAIFDLDQRQPALAAMVRSHCGRRDRRAGGLGRRSRKAAFALLAACDPRMFRADCI